MIGARHVEVSVFIGGEWRRTGGEQPLQVMDSVDGSLLGTVARGTAADADAAVRAAHAAGSDWAARPAKERADYCDAVAAALLTRTDELADLLTRETGMPLWLSRLAQVGLPVTSFQEAARVARSFEAEEQVGTSRVLREPLGVVACITPWNYPLHQVAAKVAYAIAAGCTVVVKPSEVAPLDALVLASVLEEVGLPAGVVNVVTGTGVEVGEPLVRHDLVRMVSFTGSTASGRRIASLAADGVTKVALELGGKSANVLLDDLDDELLERAVRDGVSKALINSGQTCTALTRMVVPAERLGRVEEIVVDEMERKYAPSDPFADRARLGPLASAAQRDRVQDYIGIGRSEGGRLLTGGASLPDGVPEGGYYVRPTAFSDVTNDMTVAREEIFGPVLCLLAHTGTEQAVAIANDSPYGLAGAVWSADEDRAVDVARRLDVGHVQVNGGPHNPVAPFGGRKLSGYGVEYGAPGFEEFLAFKSLQLPARTERSA